MNYRSIVVFVTPLLLVPGLLAATPAATQTIPPVVEKVEVSVINVDVTAADSSGKPVAGLTRDDFEILEDGVPQPITGFYTIENAEVRIPQAESGVSPDYDQFRRKIVLMFDNNTLNKPDRDKAIEKVEQFIDNRFAGNYEWSVMNIGPRVETVQPFTDQRSLLDAALLRVRESPTYLIQRQIDRDILSDPTRQHMDQSEFAPAYDYGTSVRFQGREQTMRNLSATINSARAVILTCRAYGAAAGKKVLVLVSGGIELNTTFSQYDVQGGGQTDREVEDLKRQTAQVLDAMVKEANAANFNIYVVDPGGLTNMAPQHDITNKTIGMDLKNASPYQTAMNNTAADTSDIHSASLTLTMGTGGRYLPSNVLSESLETIDTDTANFYSLAYTPKHQSDGKYHKISVRSKKPGVTVRHREGYLDLSTEQKLEQALKSPMNFPKEKGTLPVTLQLGTPPEQKKDLAVPLTAVMPMGKVTLFPQGDHYVGRVHVYTAIYDDKGNNVGFDHKVQDLSLTPEQFQQVSKANFRYLQKVGLKKGGSYTLVVTFRDDISNEIGTAFQDVRL